MRSLVRVLGVCTLAGAGLLPGMFSPALASTATSRLLQTNWFWYHQVSSAPVATSPAPDPEPSGVPAGDLAVAYDHGTATDPDSPSKEAYLAFDVSAIPARAVVTGFTFRLTEDLADPGAAALDQAAGAVPLVACVPLVNWAPGSGTDFAQKPTDDCSHPVAATFDPAAHSFTFRVPALATGWVRDVNYGLAVREKPGYQQPFQLDLLAPARLAAAVSYRVVTPPPGGAAAAATPGATATPGTAGGTTSGTDLAGSAAAPLALGAAVPAGSPAPSAPATTVPAPLVASGSLVSGAGAVHLRPAAGTSYGLGFALTLLAGLAVLGGVSAVLRAPLPAPALDGAGASPLSRALRRARSA